MSKPVHTVPFADDTSGNRSRLTRVVHARPVLLLAFAFAVMADPVSSVSYAIEAALRALHADLGLLVATMSLVVAIIALIIVNYQELVARFPAGGGAAAAAGSAFGEPWAFVPIGALIVDFVLTIAISVAAGASALIAYLPALAPWRIPLALGLVLVVAGVTWFGHLGRALFALLTLTFVGMAVVVLIASIGATPHPTGTIARSADHPVWAVALAFPVAMALATGVEAPSSAIAQLGQLDDAGRRQFGRVALWLTLGIVGTLTIGLAVAATRLGVGVPHNDTTQIAELARAAVPGPLFAAFQMSTALLLLAAASSSFQAGPGLLKALARRPTSNGSVGILPGWLGRTNTHHTPYVGVALFALVAAAVTAAAGGRDQELVLFYAVAVFISFLVGLLAMARFAHQEQRSGFLVINLTGAVVVAFTLAVNLTRGDPIISLAASLLIAGGLYWVWARAGRPRGIASAEVEAEHATPNRPHHSHHLCVPALEAPMSSLPPASRPRQGAARTLTIEEALDFSQQQVRRLITQAPGQLTTYTHNGRWVFDEDPWAPAWSGGFLTGMIWVFAHRTGDPWWREQAERYSLLVEPRKHDTGTHDVGFVLEPSWGRWYDEDGNTHARDVLIEGGRTMSGRLQKAGGYLSTWVDPGSTFIDVMMNVGIIFRAAKYSDDPELREIALTHCRTSRRHLMRGDGSTLHEGWFDVKTGEFLRGATHQGWRADSSWARGQAWAIYGFTTAYQHTDEADMLDAARRAADYHITHTPEHGVPPNDWMDPAPVDPFESSAAAIAAAGMLHLADALGQDNDAKHYRDYGLRILQTLRSTEFIAADTEGWQGILRHATYHYRNGLGINESVMWGEHYFVEALQLAADLQERQDLTP